MSSSVHSIITGAKRLIICFGGMSLQFGGIPPFEFLNYLSTIYKNKCDLIFFIDKDQCWYHNGIKDITHNIDETVSYLNNIINNGKYDKVLFMGISAGGYGAILFGSLCNNVNNVISFIPQTIITNPIDEKYSNLKTIINKTTTYVLHGDLLVSDISDNHHISHCENVDTFINVTVIRHSDCNMKQFRDDGLIKKYIDDIFFDT